SDISQRPRSARKKHSGQFNLPTAVVTRTPQGASAQSSRWLDAGLFARVTHILHVFDLLHDLIEIVARRILQRWEVDVGLKFLEPQRLAHGQEVPVILVSGDGPGKRSPCTHKRFDLLANGSLEGIASHVDYLGPVV